MQTAFLCFELVTCAMKIKFNSILFYSILKKTPLKGKAKTFITIFTKIWRRQPVLVKHVLCSCLHDISYHLLYLFRFLEEVSLVLVSPDVCYTVVNLKIQDSLGESNRTIWTCIKVQARSCDMRETALEWTRAATVQPDESTAGFRGTLPVSCSLHQTDGF